MLTYFTDVVVVTSQPTESDQHVFSNDVKDGCLHIPGIGPVATFIPAKHSAAADVTLVSAADAEGVDGPRALAICMEYCDRGSLFDATKQGFFQTKTPGQYRAQPLH